MTAPLRFGRNGDSSPRTTATSWGSWR